MTAERPVLAIEGLHVSSPEATLVEHADLQVGRGELVALVGPSGSGKSVTVRAALGLSAPGLVVSARRLEIDGRDVRHIRERAWHTIRGASVGFVAQEALGALDPLRPVGREIADALRLHTRMSTAQRADRVAAALEAVGLDGAMATDRTLPAALSGGMRQRALIAAATITDPPLLIADEPTTALDAGLALTVMRALRNAQNRGAGVLMITHDTALVHGWADRIVRIEHGRIVGSAARAPEAAGGATTRSGANRISGVADTGGGRNPRAVPPIRIAAPTDGAGATGTAVTSAGRRNTPILTADDLVARPGGHFAVDHVSLELRPRETLGVIGPSGSGKTTLVRVLLGLQPLASGTVDLAGTPWAPAPERRRRPSRHLVGVVTQDPASTFDPRWSIERVLVDALTRGDRKQVGADTVLEARVDQALLQVDLDPAMRHRAPSALSGGQRQRLAIARAIAPKPNVLLLDEPVTALDANLQGAVLTVLERVRETTGVAMLVVSHDLDVVERLADTVMVMRAGQVVESGETARVFGRPTHPVTATLVDAADQLRTGGRAADFT